MLSIKKISDLRFLSILFFLFDGLDVTSVRLSSYGGCNLLKNRKNYNSERVLKKKNDS